MAAAQQKGFLDCPLPELAPPSQALRVPLEWETRVMLS